MTERATLDFVNAEGSRGWEVRQAPERSRKKHIDLKNIPMMMMMMLMKTKTYMYFDIDYFT